MKSKRQDAILEIIDHRNIDTQDELAAALKQRGFAVTQATISRDIKELRLIKILAEDGVYKYALVDNGTSSRSLNVLMRIFADSVVSIEPAGNLVVIKTLSGSANAAAEAIDSMQMSEVAGTLAGDNTIFLALRQGVAAQEVVRKLKRLVK